MSLKERASRGVIWSFVDRIGEYGTQAVVSMVLARLLMPSEVGLIGMVWVFMAIAQILIDGGLGQALFQKQDATSTDECTVFYFNLVVAFGGMSLLWITAPFIGRFYEVPSLVPLIKVISFGLPIAAVGGIHDTLLAKQLDLKTQAKIGFLSAMISGVVGISMAYGGWGVWSLVGQFLVQKLTRSLLLWKFSKWRPSPIFSWVSLKGMIPFSSRLLSSGLIDAVFRNLYPVLIGKLFFSKQLGLYTMATRLPLLLSSSLSTIVSRITLPLYPTLRNDAGQYRKAVRKALTMMMFVNTPLMVGLALLADPLTRVLLTDKWADSVPYLQIYCFIMLFSPLQYGNLEALLGLGKSDLYLRLEVIKKIMSLVSILITVRWGISGLLLGELVVSIIACVLQAHYVGLCVGYTVQDQAKDILPTILVSLAMGGAMFLARFAAWESQLGRLIFQFSLGVFSFVSMCAVFRLGVFREATGLLSNLSRRFRTANNTAM